MCKLGTRNKWHHLIGLVFIVMMALSLFNLVETGSSNTSSPYFETEEIGISVKIGLTYGTRLLHMSSEVVCGDGSIQSVISEIPSNLFTSHLITEILYHFEQITDFALISLGVLTVKLYKLHQLKEQKEWAKNRVLVRMEISENPGISLRGLSRVTGLALGSTQYWLRILEQNNEVETFSLGRSNHYFIREQEFSSEQKLLFALMQNKRILEILQSFHENPVQTQKDLCVKLGYNKSLLSYYVKILKNHNVIESEIRNLSVTDNFQSFLN